uniref:Uncharacterized protein n=1 Tax=viral metagenome TaxID=1070528 RepID=A0A6C0LXI1_9ZZZZ
MSDDHWVPVPRGGGQCTCVWTTNPDAPQQMSRADCENLCGTLYSKVSDPTPKPVTPASIVVATALIMALLYIFVMAVVFMVLWNWAVKSAIPGVSKIGYGVAFGLMLFVGMFMASSRINYNGSK